LTNLIIELTHLQEIFDEVTEEQLLPAWGYDLAAVLDALTALLRHCEEIADLEDRLAEVCACVCVWKSCKVVVVLSSYALDVLRVCSFSENIVLVACFLSSYM
jgi:hypothetical protein